MKTKTVGVTHAPFQIKAAGADDGLGEGVFTGYASVFGNVDSYGDIVQPGAFVDTLAAWDAKGDPIPLLWGHDMYDPFSNLGAITSATEDATGLLVTGQLDLSNPKAAQVYKLLKGRRVTDMSFAYHVLEETKKSDGNHLLKLDLLEVSVVPIGANNETDILTVKAALADVSLKAGRALSSTNEAALREATERVLEGVRAIESVLASVAVDGPATIIADEGANPGSPADGKASGTHEDKATPTEEPSAKAPGQGAPGAEDQKAGPSVDLEATTTDYYARYWAGKDA